jgi:hypothetical protein
MEKLIFKNGQSFDAAPLGVISNDITKRRRITIKSELDYADVLALLSDQYNNSQITYTLENGTVIAVYADCVALKSLAFDIDNGTYTAEFSTDATERIVQELQTKVALMQQTIDTLTAAKEAPESAPVDEPAPDPDTAPEYPTEEPSNPEP